MSAPRRPVALLLGTESPNALYGLVRNELLAPLLPEQYRPVVIRLTARDLRFDLFRSMEEESHTNVLRQTIETFMIAARLGTAWRDQLKLVVAGLSFRGWIHVDDRTQLLQMLDLPDEPSLTVMRERDGVERDYRHGAAMFTVME